QAPQRQRGLYMNDLAKNLLLWVVIAVVLMAVFQSFSPRPGSAQELTYNQFISQVRDGAVAKVVIDSDRVTVRGERRDGTQFTTVKPDDRDLTNDLLRNDVEIQQVAPEGPSIGSILLYLLPYVFIIGIFIFFMRQLQAGSR